MGSDHCQRRYYSIPAPPPLLTILVTSDSHRLSSTILCDPMT